MCDEQCEARAIIGVQVYFNPSMVKHRVRGCAHPETEKPFCADCGAPMWRMERSGIQSTDEFRAAVRKDDRDPLYVDEDRFTGACIIGYGNDTECGQDAVRVDLPDIEKLRAHIQERLESLGYWSEEVARTFGLWVAHR